MCAGSSEGVDSINTVTVWMELTVLSVLKVPVTATADSTGSNDAMAVMPVIAALPVMKVLAVLTI